MNPAVIDTFVAVIVFGGLWLWIYLWWMDHYPPSSMGE